jgi:CRISPR-associated protein Cst1
MGKHRVYLRDWYFNAGIAGFLRLTEGLIDTSHPHFIEFSNDVFEGFEERLRKEVFLTYLVPIAKKIHSKY